MPVFSVAAAREAAAGDNWPVAVAHYMALLKVRHNKRAPLRDEFLAALRAFVQQLDLTQACTYIRLAEELYPNDSELREMTLSALDEQLTTADNVRSSLVSQWHYRMLNDRHRNQLYEAAIRQAVQRVLARGAGCSVLDIGAGAGLLSVFAARAGATSVYACEASPLLAEVCESVVKQSGVGDRVQVFAGHSDQLSLPDPVDVIVTELFDCALYGEHVCPVLRAAIQRHLRPTGLVIPSRARLYCAAVQSQSLTRQHMHSSEDGLMLVSDCVQQPGTSSGGYSAERLHRQPVGSYQLVSEPVLLDALDLTDPTQLAARADGLTGQLELEVSAETSSADDRVTVNALVCWFELDLLGPTVSKVENPADVSSPCPLQLTTHPGSASAGCCWEQAVYPQLATSCQPGDRLTVAWTLKDDLLRCCVQPKAEISTDRRIVCEQSHIQLLNNKPLLAFIDRLLKTQSRVGDIVLLPSDVGLAWHCAKRSGRLHVTADDDDVICRPQLAPPTEADRIQRHEPDSLSWLNTLDVNSVLLSPILQSNGLFVDRLFSDVALYRATAGAALTVLPGVVHIEVQLVESEQIRLDVQANPTAAAALDVPVADHINVYSPTTLSDVCLHSTVVKPLSAYTHVMALDLNAPLQLDSYSLPAFVRQFTDTAVGVAEVGSVDALVVRRIMEHSEDAACRFVEGEDDGAFGRQVFCVRRPLAVSAGQSLTLRTMLARDTLHFVVL